MLFAEDEIKLSFIYWEFWEGLETQIQQRRHLLLKGWWQQTPQEAQMPQSDLSAEGIWGQHYTMLCIFLCISYLQIPSIILSSSYHKLQRTKPCRNHGYRCCKQQKRPSINRSQNLWLGLETEMPHNCTEEVRLVVEKKRYKWGHRLNYLNTHLRGHNLHRKSHSTLIFWAIWIMKVQQVFLR